MNKYLIGLGVAAGLVVVGYLTFLYSMSQNYVQDSNTTATTGIFNRTTIYLDKYSRIGIGNRYFLDFVEITRSDKTGPGSTIVVYCNTFCPKTK